MGEGRSTKSWTGTLRRATRSTTRQAAWEAEPDGTLVFDREGWSPELFRQLARQRVACLTWRQGEPGDYEPEEEGQLDDDVPLSAPCRERRVTTQLAERQVPLL